LSRNDRVGTATSLWRGPRAPGLWDESFVPMLDEILKQDMALEVRDHYFILTVFERVHHWGGTPSSKQAAVVRKIYKKISENKY
jgi:hypothetical protein